MHHDHDTATTMATMLIALTRDMHAIIDDQDKDLISPYTWHAACLHGYWYAMSSTSGNNKPLYMHRVILMPPPNVLIDHRNGNGLDNRRHNLRLCNHQENARNAKLSSNNSSGMAGVHWHIHQQRWIARITVDYKKIQLGSFKDLDEAIAARKAAELEYFGEFAPGVSTR